MDKQPVGQLPDLTQSNNDDEIMVITNDEYNQLKKEKISDFITDLTSTDENNAIVKGTDGKLFTKDFGNASNITEGTLPTSVLPEIPLEKIPDIPKDKLPPIETSDLPASGVTADTYAYPSSVTVNAQGQVTAIEEGEPGANNANQDLSNISEAGKEVIRENSAGQPIGTLFWSFATADYVPEYALACDGTEYSNAMFTGLWNNYLTAETPKLLTKNYTQYQADITEYGSCAAFGVEHSISAVHSGTTITEVAVTAATWEGKVVDVGEYVFSYDGTNWSLNSEVVALADYGVILTGEAGAGDTVTVTYAFGTHFKVPTIKNTIYQGLSGTVPVVGTGMSLGLTNGTRNLSFVDHWDTGSVASPLISVNGYGKSIGTNGGTSSMVNGFPTIGVTTDPTKSGLVAQLASGGASGITLRCFVVVANTSDNESAMDWSEWASSLAGKANIDASNFSSEGKSLLANMAMPSDYKEDISGQISVGTGNVPLNTAPADGFLFWYVDKVPANVALFINTYVSSASSNTAHEDVILSIMAQNNYSKNTAVGFVPIAKGQKYLLHANSSNYGTNIWSQFIYAKGAIS